MVCLVLPPAFEVVAKPFDHVQAERPLLRFGVILMQATIVSRLLLGDRTHHRHQPVRSSANSALIVVAVMP